MPMENTSTTVRVAALSSIDESRWKSPKEIMFTKAGILFTLVAAALVAIEQRVAEADYRLPGCARLRHAPQRLQR